MQFKYPLAKETINKQDIDDLIEWLKQEPRLTQGKVVKEFEKRWAEYIGTKYSVFCNSGSSALLLAIYAAMIMNKNKSKNVIVPATGWPTEIAPCIQFGLNPIMVGADKDTYGIDLDNLEEILETKEIGIVIFDHVLGVPHKREKILELKEHYNFILIEDACAALGASYTDGQMVGTLGDMSTFSFYFGHQMSTIEGGMINTDDEQIYYILIMLRAHGWGKDLPNEVHEIFKKRSQFDTFYNPFIFYIPGFNLRGTDLQAFLGIHQLEKAEYTTRRRTKNHLRYIENLQDDPRFEFQVTTGTNPSSIHFACIALDTKHRKRIVEVLTKNSIETRIYTAANLGRHPFWKLYLHNNREEFKHHISDKLFERGFFLPNYPELTLEDIDFICDVVKEVK